MAYHGQIIVLDEIRTEGSTSLDVSCFSVEVFSRTRAILIPDGYSEMPEQIWRNMVKNCGITRIPNPYRNAVFDFPA